MKRSLQSRVADASRDAILEALQKHKHNRTAAAKELSISRSTLWRLMRELGIEYVKSEELVIGKT